MLGYDNSAYFGIFLDTRVSQKVMSPGNFNRFNLHIFSRNFKGV